MTIPLPNKYIINLMTRQINNFICTIVYLIGDITRVSFSCLESYLGWYNPNLEKLSRLLG
jgi:hypothetical protein